MKNKLDIQWFIEQHSDWEKLLSEKPYAISVSRDVWNGKKLMLLKYSQIDTVWSEAGNLAKECRGIILDEDTLEVVSYAFDKFFNSTEVHAAKIDASTMQSSVKIDGSILKVVRIGDNVLFSTNGTVNAFNAPVADQIGCNFKSFGDIALDVVVKKFGSLDAFRDQLQEHFTYIFELVSPWTRVVTPFHENDMYLIGCRNNLTFNEIHFKDCKLNKFFKTPDILDFSSIEACLQHAQTLDWTDEGYVVMDKDFHRVKVKNAVWLSVHHLCNNHVMSYERALEIVRANEIDEVAGYFPEFKDSLIEVKNRYEQLKNRLETSWDGFMALVTTAAPRKEAALWIQKNFDIPGVGFAMLDEKVKNIDEWLDKCPTKNLVKYLGFKDQ